MARNGLRRFTTRVASSLAALLFGLGALRCGDSGDPNPVATLDLQGLVTDASSGDPISGASVQITRCEEPLPLEQCTPKRLAEATTASDGRYHIIYTYTFLCDTPPYKAPFWAEASASGHQTQSAGDWTETPLLCTGGEQALDFALPP